MLPPAFRAALIPAAVLLSTLVAGAATSAPASGAAPVTVTSGDGLALTVAPGGTVSAVRVGDREVAGAGTAPLFSVRKVGGTPNLVADPGLEADRDADGRPDGWTLNNGTVAPRWVHDQAHTGRSSVRISSPSVGTSTSVQQVVAVRPGTAYTADVWFRTQDVGPEAATAEPGTGPSPVRFKVQQLSGSTVVSTAQAYGYTGTAGWHRKFVGFRTSPGVTSVRLVGQVVQGSGTVWLDDFRMAELFRPTWGAGSGTVAATADGASYDGTAGGMGVHATIASRPDHLRIDGVASSPTDATTPFQLKVSLPVAAEGWSWWDDPRHQRLIRAGRQYDTLTQWNEQQASRYPFSTVSDATSALTVGLPLDSPRLARVDYAAGHLELTLDLGVSPVTRSLGGARVPFSLVLYRSDPDWGYRSAIEKYYRIFPSDFVHRTDPAREGGWFGQVDRAKLDDTADDFGLGLHMVALGAGNDGGNATWGTAALPWDNARGIYTTAYNHHWGYKHPDVDAPVTPSYATEMGRIRADAAATPTTNDEQRQRDRSVATLDSGARDNNNHYLYARYQGYLQHYENLNPLDGKLDWRAVSRTYQVEPALAAARDAGATLDALHLDSVSGMRRWGAADDYYQPHWANAPYGLTFSYDSGRVVDRLAMGDAAQLQAVSDYAHDHGLFLSANFNGSDARSGAWFGAAAVDYFGLERGLPDKASGENDPWTTVDGYALFKRVLAGQRPISTIDAECDEHSTTELRERFEQTLLYGIHMGCGGTTSWTEDERAVFARYTPLLREVGAAGWEPVTGARASDPALLVERFGDLGDDGATWLAVNNPTGQALPWTLAVESATVGGRDAAGLTAEDRVSGEALAVLPGPSGDGVSVAGTLAPRSTALVRLRPSAG